MISKEDIVKALEGMSDALQLGRSESSTERLFLILADAFSEDCATYMDDFRIKAHKVGLCYDMRHLMAQSILEARTELCGSNDNKEL